MKWANFTSWCHCHLCSYSRKASDCTWQKEKARMGDGSILLLKMSHLPMRKLMV